MQRDAATAYADERMPGGGRLQLHDRIRRAGDQVNYAGDVVHGRSSLYARLLGKCCQLQICEVAVGCSRVHAELDFIVSKQLHARIVRIAASVEGNLYLAWRQRAQPEGRTGSGEPGRVGQVEFLEGDAVLCGVVMWVGDSSVVEDEVSQSNDVLKAARGGVLRVVIAVGEEEVLMLRRNALARPQWNVDAVAAEMRNVVNVYD